jgi:hypothetical protein
MTSQNYPLIEEQNVTNNPNLEENANDTKTSISNSKISSKFLLYENPDYNFKIKYPTYLHVEESNLSPYEAVRFTIPTENNFEKPDVGIGIVVPPTLLKNVTIPDVLEIYKTSNFEKIPEGKMRVINLNISEVSGNEAVNQVYYDYNTDTPMKVNAITIIKNGEIFNFYYFSKPGLFNTYFKDFEKMLNSFELIRNNNSNNTTHFNNAFLNTNVK